MECLSLRVKDVDFARHTILVREGKGGKDRVVMLHRALGEPLHTQLCRPNDRCGEFLRTIAVGWWKPRNLGNRC